MLGFSDCVRTPRDDGKKAAELLDYLREQPRS